MKRVTRPGGTVAFYVWDYPSGGLEFLRAFWTHAAALDPEGVELAEARRFPLLHAGRTDGTGEGGRSSECGLQRARHADHIPDFDDYWRPFTPGRDGPAPAMSPAFPKKPGSA